MTPNDRPWLKLPAAAERAESSVPTLRREIKAGRLRAVRVGGRKGIRIRPEWIDAWLMGGEIGGRHV